MEIRDPIHSFIEFDEREERIINSRVLQRLRRVRQLALSTLAYPGAHHTRFEHSLGAMHVAGRLCERLGLAPEETRITRLSALLHDVGHGPFSHVTEELLERFSHEPPDPDRTRKIHERVTLDILRNEPELSALLGHDDTEAIIAVLEHRSPRAILGHIVSGPMDADKLDYLLRDSFYAGVQYGVFDLARIVSETRILRVDGEEVLGISDKGFWAAEQLLFAKYHMFKQVYRHKIRSVTDAMIVRGILLAIDEGIPGVRDIFSYRCDARFLETYLENDDESLWARILTAGASSPAAALFRRLRDRRLLKRAYHRLLDAEAHAEEAARYQSMDGEARKRLETAIGTELRIDPRHVILDVRGKARPPGPLAAKDEILVERAGVARRLTEISDLFAGQAPPFEGLTVSVYLPMDEADRNERRARFPAVTERVRGILETTH